MHFKGLWRALFVALKQNTYTAFNASRKWVLKFPMRNVRQNTLRISSDCFFFFISRPTSVLASTLQAATESKLMLNKYWRALSALVCRCHYAQCSIEAAIKYETQNWISSSAFDLTKRQSFTGEQSAQRKKRKKWKSIFDIGGGARAFGNVWRKIWPLWKRSKTKSRQIMNEKLCYEFSSMITLSNSLRHLQGKRFLRMCFVATTWETLCGHTMPSQHKSTHTKRKNQKLPAAIRIRREGD